MLNNWPNKKKNIAIIGAGTGLTIAWILENQPQFNVTLFEKEARLGGHIHSIEINKVTLEAGAEFIGNPSAYANVHRLLNHLNILLQPFELSSDFNDLRSDHHVIMPPVYHTSNGKNSKPSFFQMLYDDQTQPEIRIASTLFTEFCKLLNTAEVINEAKNKLLHPANVMTLKQFVEAFIHDKCHDSKCRQHFADEYLYPLIAASWGVSIDTIKNFCAHYAMTYIEDGSSWYDAPNGLSEYIHKMATQCTKTHFALNTPIKKLVPINEQGCTKYQLLKEDGVLFSDNTGTPIVYDEVVLTTPADVTKKLLADIPHATIQTLCNTLAQVNYFDTTIAFHQDASYASQNNTVVHTRFDGTNSANTACKRWKFPANETPVMKTWVLPNQPKPKNIFQTFHYHHPVMDQNYYVAQQTIHQIQGQAGLWHGGILSGFNDSHESGITVAVHMAGLLIKQHQLCLEKNNRLMVFPQVIESVKKNQSPVESEKKETDSCCCLIF